MDRFWLSEEFSNKSGVKWDLAQRPQEVDLAKAVSTTQLLSSYLRFGLFIPLFAFNLPFSEEIQGDLHVTARCYQEHIARAGLSFSSAPK